MRSLKTRFCRRHGSLIACLTLMLTLALTWVTPASSRPYEGVTLGVSLVANEVVDDIIKPNLPEFEARTGMKVHLDAVAFGSLREKQVLEMTGRTGTYDVVLISEAWVSEYSAAGFLLPLNSLMPSTLKREYFPDLWQIGTYKNKQYVIPVRVNAYGLLYWKRPFQEMGIKVPDTWEEMLTAARAMTKNGKYGMALPARRGTAAVEVWSGLVRAAGGDLFTTKYKPRFTSPEGIEALKFWTELVKYSPPGSPTWHWPEARAALSDGTGAMHLGGISVLSSLTDPKVTRYPGEYAVKPMPVPAKRLGKPFTTCITTYNWGIAAHTKKTKAAWEFIRWMTGPEMERVQALADPRVPVESARIAYYKDPEIIKKRPVAGALQNMLKNSAPGPMIPEWPEIQNELALRISEASIGQSTPEEALRKAQSYAETVLRRAGYYK